MRTFGVEEELLLVDALTLLPLPAAEQVVALQTATAQSEHEITLEFKQEQIEVVSPPQHTLAEQLQAIRSGRALAAAAASQVGAQVVALPTAPGLKSPRLVPQPRFHKINQRFGQTSTEQLTCALHVHVLVHSRQEGVTVLNRIREWLPVLLALSTNSPFWHSVDTGFASYRYQAWNRWPMTGPTDYFDTVATHDRHLATLLSTGVPLDMGMLYFDARLCEHQPTLEVRVADVCMEATHAAVIATIIRALVETMSREWQAGIPAAGTPTSLLRAWSWQASYHGVEDQLVNPLTGALASAADVVEALIERIRPVLVENGEDTAVASVVEDIVNGGSGARRQREAFAVRHDLRDVVALSLEATHHDGPGR